MKVSTILDKIDNGSMALPQFQRGYVWNGTQVRDLMDSMYLGHPVGSLLAWNTDPDEGVVRGGQDIASGAVQLLLDGQQRITSLYGIIRGAPPPFFDGSRKAFTGLHFHLDHSGDDQKFAFWQPTRMKDDPLWIDVTQLMQRGNEGVWRYLERLRDIPDATEERREQWFGRITQLLAVREKELHIEEVTGNRTLEDVVGIFNRVNSGGTKLSKGDLALAKICAKWPDARDRMKGLLQRWSSEGYHFSLDWLLRNVNAVVTGEAEFDRLDSKVISDVQHGLDRAEHGIERVLNLIADRLGLDHNQALFGKNALPIMVHYIDRRSNLMDGAEQDRLLYWYFQSAMWGRFSGSTETALNQDLRLLKELDGGIERLIEQLRLSRGSLHIEPGHFVGHTRGARFYPVLYALTRSGEARDWGTGEVLKKALLGKMSALEMHHIFPKALLRKDYHYREVNAIANYCFLTKDTNIRIGARPPSEYFPEIEAKHPGALESQWIPMDRELWKAENYPQFLKERQRLLADAANRMLDALRHEAAPAPVETAPAPMLAEAAPTPVAAPALTGGVDSDDEETALRELNAWVHARDLREGQYEYEIADLETGAPLAVLDLAWPDGLQVEYSQRVAVVLDEDPATLQLANDRGFRHFTSVEAFRRYAEAEVLGPEDEADAA